MWGYLDDFVGNLREIAAYRDLPVPELLATVFPDLRYIYVTRRDKVRQAVSLWKAIQNSIWGQQEGSPAPQANHKLVFHVEAIDHLLRRTVDHEEAWRRLLRGAQYSTLPRDLRGVGALVRADGARYFT